MLHTPLQMEHSNRRSRFGPQRTLLGRTLKTKASRLGTLSAVVTIFLVLALWIASPKYLPRVAIQKDVEIPAYRMPEPMSYDDELDAPNWKYRENAVKKAFLHAYQAYEDNAFPADELWPISNQPRQNFNGWGVSIIDGMDTMHLLGLKLQFERAVVHVSTMKFEMPEGDFAHFFETTIRYLGGLLSAHALSNEPILLKKADELARKMLPVFDTPSGLPTFGINTKSGEQNGGINKPRVLLAEIASCQLEYRYLAHLTGKAEYYRVVEKINSVLQMNQNLRNDSLWASQWETDTAKQVNSHITVGAWADSAYEYLLKQYLQTSKSEPRFKRMYLRATKGILETLLYLSPTRHLLYITDTWSDIPTRKLEHLACFYPGLLALGAQALSNDTTISQRDKSLHHWAAEGLAHTCWTMYGESKSGLAPEEAQFVSGFLQGVPKTKTFTERWINHVWTWEAEGSPGGKPPGVGNLAELMMKGSGVDRDYTARTASYLLRPETIESIYLMWKTTGDEIWRERGWAIFKAIERHCRLHVGYASVANVEIADPHAVYNKLDDMPSYAFAETWKYLFLLFTSKDPFPLDKWVFNTEAHPLPVFEWDHTEKEHYNILIG
ncbi:glycoside hydrolase family 47 protein [Ramaria rubella]|nr:glycoside hydrolase family 47 protein [Ramaria rubella]